MKLSHKITLSFCAAFSLVAFAAGYTIHSLNRSINSLSSIVEETAAHEKAANLVLSHFKTQVQEWKNTLLRGKNPEALSKHWNSFKSLELKVREDVAGLLAHLPEGQSKALLSEFSAAHDTMRDGYLKGFDAFKASGFDAAAGDAAVKGMDRKPAELLEQLSATLAEESASAATAAAASARRTSFTGLVMMVISLCSALAAGLWLGRSVLRQIGGEPADAVGLARRVADGDLGCPIQLRAGDKDSLMAHLAVMQSSLADLVGNVRRSSDSVSMASTEIADGNNDLSARTEQQAGTLQQTAASMEQLSSAVAQNADNARQGSQLAQSARALAEKCGSVVSSVTETMLEINDSSRKVSEIIGVIDLIAFQTNILALNAAVEAARAGEQGRGFAVVASEVRALASRSAEAAKQVRTLISANVDRVESGTTLVNQAGATMSEVVGSIHRVASLMSDISSASDEQSLGVTQIGEAIQQIDQVTQQNAALVEEMAAAASSLKSQSRDLVGSVARFRVEKTLVQANARH